MKEKQYAIEKINKTNVVSFQKPSANWRILVKLIKAKIFKYNNQYQE